MVNPLLTVETVEHRIQMRRFADIGFLVSGHDERWHPGVRAYEQWRLDERRHPYFDRGIAAYFLARRAGRPVGRIAAHLAHDGAADGWFGFFDAPDDHEVVAALVDAAARWLTESGASSMTGPVTWTTEEEFGVPVDGADRPGVTGRPWKPSWYADRLAGAGLQPDVQRAWYRLASQTQADPPPVADEPLPPHAGRFGDRRLVLAGIAAVPDVTDALSTASLRSAWSVARRAKARQFDTAVVVRIDGDPAVLVPRMQLAAGHAGYRWLVSPWAPTGTPVETVHQVFSRRW